MHEPGTVVVHIHGPGFIILPKHHILHNISPGDPKCRVRVVVIAIDGHLPVVHTTRKPCVPHDNTVIVTVTRHREVVVGQDDVRVGRCRVKGEPGNCRKSTHTYSHQGSLSFDLQ